MSNFKAISWEQFTFNEMMRSVLYWTNTLNWIFIVLDHWNISPLVDMLLHYDTLSWIQANHLCSRSLVFIAVCLAENRKYQFYCLVWPDMGSIPWSTTLSKHRTSLLGDLRENRGDFWKASNILMFLSHYCIFPYLSQNKRATQRS